LPTKLARIVVTDDQGRYLVPDLPRGNYKVWVRGYGLVDSQPVQSTPGKTLNLTAAVAPNPKAAAEYYPASQWYSLLRIPDKSEFPGTGPNGNGISEEMKSQAEWLKNVKTDGCITCHQLGNKATRELSAELGTFSSSVEAWDRRIQSGQAGGNMSNNLNRIGRKKALELFADWTDRIKAGEVPPAPPRPQGAERNVVVSVWDWAGPQDYFHDSVSSDKRNPRVNANGLVFGVHELSTDNLSILDPVRNVASDVRIPTEAPIAAPREMPQPSPYWGDELIWDSKANAHNPMIDHRGRVWLTSRVRGNETPAFCRQGSDHPSAKLFPVNASGRQLALYDPSTKQFKLINTCYGTHHLFFAEDANHTLWTSGGGQVVGWLNTKMYDATGDDVKSQGWAPLILDTNGNGRQDAWAEPNQPLDPAKDKRLGEGFYGVMPSPADGSIWGSTLGFPGALVRLNPGSNPPSTTLAEIYEVPWGNDVNAPVKGFAPRGMDVDRNGVVWAPLASGHFASFDRRKCRGPLNGPNATGKHCP
ncbi:MAG: carboxypeptidase-like regulatory domain-containing protein, partial [Terriglobia bacterium]